MFLRGIIIGFICATISVASVYEDVGISDTPACEENAHSHYTHVIKEATDLEEGQEIYKCWQCDEEIFITIKKLPHTHQYVETIKQPTCTKTGIKTNTCYCGEILTEELPIIAHDLSDWKIVSSSNCYTEGVE